MREGGDQASGWAVRREFCFLSISVILFAIFFQFAGWNVICYSFISQRHK